jgi:hypothetical protein
MKLRSVCLVCSMLAGFLLCGSLTTVQAQSCPPVDAARELMIRDLGVVEDAARTTGDGAWSFKHLMESMAPSAAEAPDMVEAMLSTWLTDQSINGHVVPARAAIQELVLSNWPRLDGALDLSRAPMRLLAIVNRLDLRDLDKGQAGEGRFVFGVTDSSGTSTQFTLIFEYALPATSTADVLDWTNRWHELNAFTPGSAEYNAVLEGITERFAGPDADPSGVNGSALNQIRTNEVALAFPWELRELTLSASGLLQPDTVKLTPDSTFMGQALVADFVNQNESVILEERHSVPNEFAGVSFLGGSSINNLDPWLADGITNNEARHKFSLNTCNGCHGNETNTTFLHISTREAGAEASISGFLSGEDVTDPVDGSVRHFDDLSRRAEDMAALLCTSTGLQRRSTDFIEKGIGRVH